MLFWLSSSLLRYRNALRVTYWAASCSGRGHLWERNTVRRHEPNPTPILLVKLKDRCRSWRKQTTGWNCLANPDSFRRILSERRIGCGKKRNGRIEGNICQHVLILFRSERRARLFAFYPLAALIIRPY